MSNSRTRNSIRNVSYGLIITIINAIISFISRKFFVKFLGLELLSINGLFSDVIAVISLAELGVGMAIVYSLYKPLYDGNQEKISQLMSLYRTAYHVIAGVTIALSFALLPFIDKLIKDVVVPLPFLRVVFLLFAFNTASSYLFSYKTALLNADQKQYIVSLITAIIRLLVSVITIAVLYLFKNYILYLVLQIVQSLSTNLVLAKYVDRHYTFLRYKDKLPAAERRKIFGDIKNIFVKRISGVITSSTDNILISVLVSTLQVGLYNNYQMMFSVVRTLKRQITNGLTASIGNLTVNESAEKAVVVLKRLTFLYFCLSSVISAGLMSVSSDIVTLWLGAEYVMPKLVIYTAVLNIFIEICCEPLWQYLEVSGLFQQDKYIGVLGSAINLLVSLILGKVWGIVGIFAGTVCTQVVQLVLKTILLFKKKFGMTTGRYFLIWLKLCLGYVGLVATQVFCFERISMNNLYFEILIKGFAAVLASTAISVLLFIGTPELKYSRQLLKDILRKEIK